MLDPAPPSASRSTMTELMMPNMANNLGHVFGGVILSLSTETLEFPSRLVLSHAPYAHPLKPKELIDKTREEAQNLIDIYQLAKSK